MTTSPKPCICRYTQFYATGKGYYALFTKENLFNLIKLDGRDAVGTAVANIPDEEVRNALMMLVIHHQKTIAWEKSLWHQKQDCSMALEPVYMDSESPGYP